uniref:Cadherin-8 n=1 Tax=Sphaerodactylus townsendi TaxID=933632 RepID=A0ACB8E9U0_9SAUR
MNKHILIPFEDEILPKSPTLDLHTDLDPGISKIKYILSGDGAGTIFVINDKTGDIHAMKRLDREEKAEYTLTAQAVDRDTNKPLEPPSEFIIKVQDINDNAPEFVEGPYHATVPEMSIVGMYARPSIVASPNLNNGQHP